MRWGRGDEVDLDKGGSEHQGRNKTEINSVLFSCQLSVLILDPRHVNHAAKAEKKSNLLEAKREKVGKIRFQGFVFKLFFEETGAKKMK